MGLTRPGPEQFGAKDEVQGGCGQTPCLGLAIRVLKKWINNQANKTESVDDSKKDDAF